MSFLHNLLTLSLSVLAGLGVGSGGLFILWLTEGMKMEHGAALFFNLCFFISALACAVSIHARRRMLDYRFLLEIVLFGIPGVFLGRWLNTFFSPLFLRLLLGLFSIGSGVFSLIITKKKKD